MLTKYNVINTNDFLVSENCPPDELVKKLIFMNKVERVPEQSHANKVYSKEEAKNDCQIGAERYKRWIINQFYIKIYEKN